MTGEFDRKDENAWQHAIEVDGYRLEQRVEGSGSRRLMVVGSAAYYQRAFPAGLRNHMQIAFVDHRGYVKAPDGQVEQDVTLEMTLQDMELHRLALGWDDFIILGHSGHGFMAMEYAKRHQDKVSGVVLMNLGPSYSKADSEITEREWEALVDPDRKALWAREMALLGDKIAAEPDNRFLLFMFAMGARSWADATYDSSWLWEGVSVNLPAIDRMWGVDFAQIDIAEGLSDFKRPVLLGMGLWDYLVPRLQTWDRVRSDFRDLTVKLFAHSGHTPMVEEAAHFSSELIGWLEAKRL